ncbi:hypothetical protein MNBD_PLANCTO02-421 [hydrothermal vent metagenome]|uniref:Uncharacterized protein n=1 Tax=hydrothermal vent metagenome TaxID=652676 RepID=A0A3B1D9Z1_9ZZZZ
MIKALQDIDKRWIFLAMAIAVAVPILFQVTFPEKPGKMVMGAFNKIEELPPGSNILVAIDYGPGSQAELDPMATALVSHCCEKGHKLFFVALWATGTKMISKTIDNVIKEEYPQMEYGKDYVNLGFKSGSEGLIIVIGSDIRKSYAADEFGTSLDEIEMTKDIKSIQEMDLILSVSAGTPGTKEWIQYGPKKKGTNTKVPIIGGCTGVQAPLLYPYYPEQMVGLLGAIKGAAEYEAALLKAQDENGKKKYVKFDKPKFREGLRRMAPQLSAHILMVGLIILGNIIFFMQRK